MEIIKQNESHLPWIYQPQSWHGYFTQRFRQVTSWRCKKCQKIRLEWYAFACWLPLRNKVNLLLQPHWTYFRMYEVCCPLLPSILIDNIPINVFMVSLCFYVCVYEVISLRRPSQWFRPWGRTASWTQSWRTTWGAAGPWMSWTTWSDTLPPLLYFGILTVLKTKPSHLLSYYGFLFPVYPSLLPLYLLSLRRIRKAVSWVKLGGPEIWAWRKLLSYYWTGLMTWTSSLGSSLAVRVGDIDWQTQTHTCALNLPSITIILQMLLSFWLDLPAVFKAPEGGTIGPWKIQFSHQTFPHMRQHLLSFFKLAI